MIKAGSSKWFHENHHRLFLWQEGFGAYSVSASSVSDVIHYIETQEEHHRKMSFSEEWRLLVEKYSIVAGEEQIHWRMPANGRPTGVGEEGR